MGKWAGPALASLGTACAMLRHWRRAGTRAPGAWGGGSCRTHPSKGQYPFAHTCTGLLPRRFHTRPRSLTTTLSRTVGISPRSRGGNGGAVRVSASAKVAGARPRRPGHAGAGVRLGAHSRERWRPQTPRRIGPGQAGERARSPGLLTAGRERATAAARRTGAAAAPLQLLRPACPAEAPAAPAARPPPSPGGPARAAPAGPKPPACSPRLPAVARAGGRTGGAVRWPLAAPLPRARPAAPPRSAPPPQWV